MNWQNTLRNSLENALRTLADVMVLNWLWFFCCLPVITAGPATCAMYAVTLKLARKEPVSCIRDYFRAFRSNLKNGLILGIIALAALAVAVGDALFALEQTGMYQIVYLVLATVLGLLLLTFICYCFALQAMFDNPLKTQIKNGFLLALTSPGKTIMLWMITSFPILAAIFLPVDVLRAGGFLYLICGFSGPVYLNSQILRNIFDKINGGPIVPAPDVGE